MSNSSRDVWNQIKPGTIRGDYQDTYVIWLKDNFRDSANYFQVNKNFDYNTLYDVLIKDYDAAKKIVPTKSLISWPYDTFQFETGDYIHWNYNNVLTTWLIIASDKQYTYNFNGQIRECKNTLSWKDDDDNIISYPCVIIDSFTNTEFDFYKNMIVSAGDIVISVQANIYTDTIRNNDRFVFDGQSFMVKAYNNFISPDITTFIMRKDNIAYDDTSSSADSNKNEYNVIIEESNFSQLVGYTGTLNSIVTLNDDIISKSVDWSSSSVSNITIDNSGNIDLLSIGSSIIRCELSDNPLVYDEITVSVVSATPVSKTVIFDPPLDNIKQGYSVNFSVYKFTDGVQQADTFSIVSSGVTSEYYDLTIVDGNHFEIQNLKVNYDSDLTVTCTSLSDGTIGTLTIRLKGFW